MLSNEIRMKIVLLPYKIDTSWLTTQVNSHGLNVS